jgi:hypothetical protein
VKVYIFYVALKCFLYILFTYIHNRLMSDFFEVFIYYNIIGLIVFLFSLLKTRKTRWVIFSLIIVLPITYFIFSAPSQSLVTSSELLLHGHKVNTPFLPKIQFKLKNDNFRLFFEYLLFFILPILYFYAIYSIAKFITHKKTYL